MSRVWLATLWMGCTAAEGPSQRSSDAGPLRVVFIADTHVIGPQYTCCSESEGVDNASIVRTAERLASTVERINGIEPRPEHVFVLGDVVHAAHRSHDPAWYESEENAFTVAADLLGRLDMPVHILWGNHDYEVQCGGGDHHYSRDFSHGLFSTFFDAEPTSLVEASGWRFVLLNSQLGPTWDADDPACDTSLGSFGAEQLAWLDEVLSAGLPSMVLTHHHLLTSTAFDENDGPNPDLTTVIRRHDNVAAHMAGHLHRWYDLDPSEVSPVRHLILGATRYDDDNFWVMDLREDGGFELVDYDKPQWFTTCADTWSYDGSAVVVTDAVERGDCSI